MTSYSDEAGAAADGITIVHERENSRFAVYRAREGSDPQLIGRAHYTLLGDDGIDFDGTFVVPEMRGTGISGLLAHRAVTSEIVKGRRVRASCWYIEQYLTRHPELVGDRD